MSAEPTTIASRRAAVAFVFVTVVLDVLALGIVIPVLPMLLLEFLGGDTAQAARIGGLFGTAWAAMQFVFSPVLGMLSDRIGRRPVILVSNAGLALDYVLMALAPTLAWLFVGRVLSGITAASISTAGAYIADVTPPEQRAKRFGLLGAAFGLGFVIGPALGGLLGEIDPRLPFWVAGGLSLANFCYGFFVLPESLPPERRAPRFEWRRANPMGSLRLLRSHPELFGLAGVAFLQHLAHYVFPSVFVFYAYHRYAWSERDVGLTLAVVGVCSALVQAGLVGRVVGAVGERRTVLAALVFGTIGFTGYALAPTGAWFIAVIPLMALWGLAGAPTQALMTRRLAPHEQGQLQGALSSLMGVAGLVGPLLFTVTFAQAIAHREWQLPGAPFLVSALLLVAGLVLAERATRARSPARPS